MIERVANFHPCRVAHQSVRVVWLQLAGGLAGIREGLVQAGGDVRAVSDRDLEDELRLAGNLEPGLLGQLTAERIQQLFVGLDLAAGQHPDEGRVVGPLGLDQQ